MCNHRRECHCDPGWAAPYCEQEISGIAAGTVPGREPGDGLAPAGRCSSVPSPGLFSAGSGSAVLAAGLAVLALAGVGLGSGAVILRARAARRSHKG